VPKPFSALSRALALTFLVGVGAAQTLTPNSARSSSASALKPVTLRVKAGQSLWTLARAHGMTLAQIEKLNGLRGDKIRIGQRVKVLVPQPTGRSSAGVVPKKLSRHARALAQLSPKAKRLLKIRYTQYLARQRKALGARYAVQAKYRKYLALLSQQRRVLQARYARQAKFEKYLALQAQQYRSLQARYARQAKFERYLALKNQQRRTLQARYALQVKFERYRAQLQARRAATLRQQVAARNSSRYNTSSFTVASRSSTAVRKTSFGGSRLSWPISNFQLTSRFGTRDLWIEGSNRHTGIDLAADTGTPIYAASSGTVTQSGSGMYGINVYVNSGNMDLIYGHMSRTAVSVGEYVNRGELLGYVGCTGHCTGPHLHFEVRIGGTPRDPMGFMG